jgi:hypothetical protein
MSDLAGARGIIGCFFPVELEVFYGAIFGRLAQNGRNTLPTWFPPGFQD